MKRDKLYFLGPLIGGLVFAIGLGMSGMLVPKKIIGFLDIFGAWDPTLVFVMIGAISTHMLMYRIIGKRTSPLFDVKFHLPTKKDIDAKLIVGSTLFGIGWAMTGLCPAPGLVTLVTMETYVLVFVAAMVIGIFAAKYLFNSGT